MKTKTLFAGLAVLGASILSIADSEVNNALDEAQAVKKPAEAIVVRYDQQTEERTAFLVKDFDEKIKTEKDKDVRKTLAVKMLEKVDQDNDQVEDVSEVLKDEFAEEVALNANEGKEGWYCYYYGRPYHSYNRYFYYNYWYSYRYYYSWGGYYWYYYW